MLTIERLRVAAGLAATDNSQDAEIDVVIQTAMAMIENYCDRKFPLQDTVERFTHKQGYSVTLARYPIVQINSVRGDNNQTILFHVNNDNGVVHFDGRVHAHEIVIDYRGGYAPDAIPADLEFVIINLFKTLWDAQQGGGSVGVAIGAVKNAKIGDLSLSYETGSGASSDGGSQLLSSTWTTILDYYKRYSV